MIGDTFVKIDAEGETGSHFRFYIYMVENPGRGSKIRYRTAAGDWDSRFSKSMLWDDLDFVKTRADELVRQMNRDRPQVHTTIVVGRAITAPCPFFAAIVMGSVCKE